MIYYIDYFHWIAVCSFFVILLFLFNIKSKRVVGIFFILNFLIMFAPRMAPLTAMAILDYNEDSERDSSKGKVIDNMISFTDNNYTINSDIDKFNGSELAPGFYDDIKVMQTRQLLDNFNIKVYVHIETSLKYVWVKEEIGE